MLRVPVEANDFPELSMANVAPQELTDKTAAAGEIPWLEAGQKYALGIDAGKLVCRQWMQMPLLRRSLR